MEDEFLKALRARCDEVGALLIFDEVQTGMGRTGVPFVSSSAGVMSDISTVAKGLAGGFPMSAVLMTRDIDSSLKKGDLGATFGGHPFAMAAMIATIEKIESYNLVEKANRIEKHIRDVFDSTGVKRILGRGCLLGLDIDDDAKAMQSKLFEKGIITGTCSNPSLVHLLPPLTIEVGDIDHFKSVLVSLL
jgi:acetylornithine/succinyldiaminopimelate/putrescine aminotransferase